MTKRQKRWLLASVLIFLAILLTAEYVIGSIIRNAALYSLEKLDTRKELVWNIGTIKYRTLEGALHIESIQIEPDSSIFQASLKDSSSTGKFMKLGARNLRVLGLDLYDIFIRKELDISAIKVEDIDLTLYRNIRPDSLIEKDSADVPSIQETLVVKGMKSIGLEEINVNRFAVHRLDAMENDTLQAYKGNQVFIRGLALNPRDMVRGFFDVDHENMSIHLSKHTFSFNESNYQFYFEDLAIFVKQKSLELKGFILNTTSDKYELATTYPTRKDVIEVRLPTFNIHGMNLQSALYNGVYEVDSISVDSFELAINNDRKLPANTSKRPYLPNQVLAGASFPMKVQKIHLKNGNLRYEERNNMAAGLDLTMKNLDLSINNIQTHAFPGPVLPSLEVSLNGHILGNTEFDIALDFPYSDTNENFYFSGNLGSFPFKDVNSYMPQPPKVIFTGGVTSNVAFNANCNSFGCQGTMTMLYKDLKIEVEKNRKQENNKKLSLLANILIHSNNPHNGRIRKVTMAGERVPHKGIVPMLLRTLTAGIEETILP